MLKLKIIVSMLAVAGMTIFILGDTYLTTGLFVACAAVALPMSIYLNLGGWRGHTTSCRGSSQSCGSLRRD